MDDNNEEQKSFPPILSSSYNYSESSKKYSLPISNTRTPGILRSAKKKKSGIFGSAKKKTVAIRGEFVNRALSRANTLLDDNIYDNIHKQNEFRKQTVLDDESLTKDEKTEAIKLLAKYYDKEKVLYNEGTRRTCENCNQECLATLYSTLYCEYCVKNYLKANFLNWTSVNYDIDNLIQKCQLETLSPNKIIEWIPYNNLKNIKYLTKGGFSEIFTADWIDGYFYKWNTVKQQLKRIGTHKVILKKLENIESANQSWFNEVKYHLTLSNKYDFIVRCFGLTQNPSNGNYVLVMRQLDINLREYLQQYHNKLTWKEGIQITVNIIKALVSIHKENLIHRDLHSGNILYDGYTNSWFIGEFGFCGPADKSIESIYGNLPYIAPEIMKDKNYTFASDIYSIGILMWEISSGQPPFINFEHDYIIAMNILNGMRPKIVPGTPLEYKILMEHCWDADPLVRPDINALWRKVNELKLDKLDKLDELFQSSSLEIDNLKTVTSRKLFTSRIHQFENLPEPKNATEEEQEVFHSKLYSFNSFNSFNISNNIYDFNKSTNEKNTNISKSITKVNKEATVHKEETVQQIKNYSLYLDDDDNIYNNPNFHLEMQDDDLEIPNESSNEGRTYNHSNTHSKRHDEYHHINDNNSEVKVSIFWSNALETRLCELYMKDDVIDIFWGCPVEEHFENSTKWNIYVITRGLYYPYAKKEIIADGQIINFIAEEERLISFDDPLPNSLKIPQDLKEKFNEALDNELRSSFRDAHYNLVGIGTGYKQIRGKFTEIPAIIFYVRQKGILRRGCDGLLPKEIRGFPTDVIEACVAIPCAGLGIDTCRRYQENVKLGSSIGIRSEKNNTTGTLSAVAYENNPPNRIGIISCEHVLKFNESKPEEKITIYQPSYNDLFEPKKKLEELLDLSKESEDGEGNEYIDEINEMMRKLNLAESRNSTLATYVKGMRENFVSMVDNKKYGIDAGFCVFDNENRKLSSKNFPIPSNYFKNAGLSNCLEGTYTYCELKNFDYNNKVFKVGRTTGLTLGQLLPTDQAIACSLTNESIKNAKNLEMEKHIQCYNNADQKIFVGYMKSRLDSEICQKRKKCYPVKWFDRQLAFQFEFGEFECGDSGASVLDKQGKALGILHARLRIPNQTFGIASPYFTILEALDVSIYLSSNPVKPTPSIISPPPSYISLPFSNNKNDCERLTPPPSYLSSNVQNDYSRVNKRNMDINVETYNNPKRSKIDQKDL
ncbi:hypothetical protein RhiirA1_460048 [Rhizophagus irregularis]|uniref:Protein kinase domain-containing protein n=1 Tax=Rhizophagus irregularis TaxID=588596 RepID=A0A2N0RSB9_9GLOM|nr:hypothetical protein RhiirA1_460048 [Rhizophagus irregularis]